MKTSIAMLALGLLVACVSHSVAATDISRPLPVLTLPDGRVLKNAMLANFTAESVLVRHSGGSTVLRYEFLPDEIRPAAESKRPGGPRIRAGDTIGKKVELKGQIYVTTAGAGAYKFSNVRVYAFDQEHFTAWGNTLLNPVKLPLPIGEGLTDADGRFRLTVPADRPYFLFAQASRLMVDGRTERLEWRAPNSEIKKPDEVYLSNNWRVAFRPVEIEKQP